ncbi:MAG: tetratricopeptide repeat protein [Ruminiclostridium sp.]
MKNNLLSIDQYRNNPEFYFSKGLRCANKKNLSDAFKNLQKALVLEPDNCEYKFNTACFLSEMQRPKDANRIFNDILLNLDPTMYDCYFGLGCNSFELGDSEKAAEYFEKYLYFDNDGEFSEEVAEMIFYLKLYDDISHDDGFKKRSNNSFRNAKRYLQENRLKNATRELCKAINSNPFNVRARNLLTLTLMGQKNYNRAHYISKTVKIINKDDVWSNCLSLYILSLAGKHSKVNKLLETLMLGEIGNREDLLCVITTLLVFNRVDELILLLELYIIQYSDLLVYSTLLLGYTLTKNVEKVNEIYSILHELGKSNSEFVEWLKYIKSYNASQNEKLLAIAEYNKIFSINKEADNPMYNPIHYQELFNQLHRPKQKLSKSYLPIIECAVQHREIMYTRYYEKEIIGILIDCVSEAKDPFEAINDGVAAYSAALEYTYCKQYFIDMGKEELIQKYKLSSITFDKALKKIKI